MNTIQYRALIAYVKFWVIDGNFTFKEAITHLGITLSEEEVVDELWKSGWTWDSEHGTLEYEYEE